MKYFFKFSLIGGLGFFVDTMIFYMANSMFTELSSRILSFSMAVLFTYVFNRLYTFKVKTNINIVEFFKYYLNMIFGGIVNIGTFFVVIRFSDIGRDYPFCGIALGSVAGLCINFLTSKILLATK